MKHYHRDIFGYCNFSEMYREAVERFPAFSHFVEVGSFLGQSSVYMAVEINNSKKKITLDCIDIWDIPNTQEYRSSVNFLGPEYVSGDDVYMQFLKNIEPVRHIIKPIKLPSVTASKLYEDESLDLVFLDGDHRHDAVYEDCKTWFPKIKNEGAAIAGDDYVGETKEGIDTFFKTLGIVPNKVGRSWYVTKDNKEIWGCY